MPGSYLMGDRRRGGQNESGHVQCSLSLEPSVPLQPPKVRGSAVLGCCIVFEWTAKQPALICLHIAVELAGPTSSFALGTAASPCARSSLRALGCLPRGRPRSPCSCGLRLGLPRWLRGPPSAPRP